jgi:hypothetical protein
VAGELLLQPLVGVVDAQLLEGVDHKLQNTTCSACSSTQGSALPGAGARGHLCLGFYMQ